MVVQELGLLLVVLGAHVRRPNAVGADGVLDVDIARIRKDKAADALGTLDVLAEVALPHIRGAGGRPS